MEISECNTLDDFSLKKTKVDIKHASVKYAYYVYVKEYEKLIKFADLKGCLYLFNSGYLDVEPRSIKYPVKDKQELKLIVNKNVPDTPKYADDLNWIDTSKVNDMGFLFEDYTDKYSHLRDFNCDISEWDVSNVINMDGMFFNCCRFNRPLDKWNVSNVLSMEGMFFGCESFNQPLNSWNVSNVKDMSHMFKQCHCFNQPLGNWDVSKVTDMHETFYGCTRFNQNISSWDVSNVTTMMSMFFKCLSFNQPLNDWNVANVTDMHSMFYMCESFNQPLNSWDINKVGSITYFMDNCKNYKQDLSDWTNDNLSDRSLFLGTKMPKRYMPCYVNPFKKLEHIAKNIFSIFQGGK